MKQKTIRLRGGDYIMEDDGTVLEGDDGAVTDQDYWWNENCKPKWLPTNYRVGMTAVLMSSEDTSGVGKTQYYLLFCDEGAPGNSNPKIKLFHGWRGTSNNTANYAHGKRKITAIRVLKNGDVAVTVGKDLCPNAP